MTEGALATKRHVKLLGYALSLTRLRRELPPGGSLWHNTLLPKKTYFFLRIGKAFFDPRDYRVVFILQKSCSAIRRSSLCVILLFPSVHKQLHIKTALNGSVLEVYLVTTYRIKPVRKRCTCGHFVISLPQRSYECLKYLSVG